MILLVFHFLWLNSRMFSGYRTNGAVASHQPISLCVSITMIFNSGHFLKLRYPILLERAQLFFPPGAHSSLTLKGYIAKLTGHLWNSWKMFHILFTSPYTTISNIPERLKAWNGICEWASGKKRVWFNRSRFNRQRRRSTNSSQVTRCNFFKVPHWTAAQP